MPGKYSSDLRYMSENEVFLTEHKDLTNVECINGPCEVISFEKYEGLTGIPGNTFFSRFFIKKKIKKMKKLKFFIKGPIMTL